jgi:glycosyltransferase involved in cell wall biosynthesis
MANALTGCEFPEDTLIVGTSGRYEFRNKGIDVFIEAMNSLRFDERLKKPVLALIEVPAWVGEPRLDLYERMKTGETYDTPLENPMITHWLYNMNHDNVLGMMRAKGMWNSKEDKVKLIFIPCYLNGNDGILDMPYYDAIIGKDLTAYPSYYEPWGYTPLESVAFKVPCITTDLAGFGLWANSEKGGAYSEITDGVKTIHRTDYNYFDVAESIKDTIVEYSLFSDAQVKKARAAAEKLSKKALWNEFIKYYWQAYDFALRHRHTDK